MAKRRDWAKIGEVVNKVLELGLTYKEGAEQFGVKVNDLYDYNRRQNRKEAPGEKGETEGPGGGGGETGKKGRGVQLPEEVQELIRSYRRDHPRDGFKRIADLLKHKYLVVVTRKQIRRVLKEAGLLETCDSSFDKEAKKKGTRRFEARYAGEMWQMDVTYVYIRKLPVLYLVVIVDDYSRFCVAAELCRDQRAETLIGVLHNACTVYGTPEKLLTDQASGFYSWSKQETQFQEYLDAQKIEHIVAEPHSPQSQGKAERLIQTIRVELLTRVKFTGFTDAQAQIHSYIQSYNFDRPHQALNGKRPADRFHGVVAEVELAESELADRNLDLSRGYVVYKVQDHRVCVACSAEGLQVYLDGTLLKEADGGRIAC
jgi:transposase InsO family protein